MTTITINAETIAKLQDAGFNRWTKNGMDRLYVNADTLGLVVEVSRSGHAKSEGVWNGADVYKQEADEILHSKVWIDVTTGELHVVTDFAPHYGEMTVEDAAIAYVESILGFAKDEATETETEETISVTVNQNGIVELNDGIRMEVSHDDGDVFITLYGIAIPDGEHWLDYSEYAIESWGSYREPLLAWLTERGVSARHADTICELASNLNDYSLNC